GAVPDERRARLLRHGGRRHFLSRAGEGASALAYTGDEPGIAGDLVLRAGSERKIRRAFYLRDVHDGPELCADRGRAFCTAADQAGHVASLPLLWISLGASDLRGAGELVGRQCGGGKEKRDAVWDRDRVAGSTILFLLEEAEESRRGSAKLIGTIKIGLQDVL